MTKRHDGVRPSFQVLLGVLDVVSVSLVSPGPFQDACGWRTGGAEDCPGGSALAKREAATPCSSHGLLEGSTSYGAGPVVDWQLPGDDRTSPRQALARLPPPGFVGTGGRPCF